MKNTLSRRDLFRLLSAVGLGPAFASRAMADETGAAPATTKEIQPVQVADRPRYPAFLRDGKVIQPERPLSVFRETDVLVVADILRQNSAESLSP